MTVVEGEMFPGNDRLAGQSLRIPKLMIPKTVPGYRIHLAGDESGRPSPLEMALIGNEGMLGATLGIGVNLAPMRAVVQGAGTALRMSAEQFQQQLHDTPYLLRTLHRYLYVQMAQFSRTAACTHFHEIEPRLACLLLTTHDRAHADHFYLTHEYLAAMFGGRRSGIRSSVLPKVWRSSLAAKVPPPGGTGTVGSLSLGGEKC